MVALILIAICIIFCGLIVQNSLKNMAEKRIDNGASSVVTIGVIFTFVGISFGLFNFDTDPATMSVNINEFLEGMKTAFITSIIGMVCGIYIKWKQSDIEKANDDSIDKNVRAIIGGLGEIKSSVDANSTASLQQELASLVTAMSSFVSSSNASRADMQNLSKNMQQQVETMERLSTTFQALSQKIVESGENQTARLDTMNTLIQKMQASSEQAQKNSAELLRETEEYQRQSLANDEKLAKVLQGNTDRITEMKNSFDGFLKNMAENYSQELIRALNESMSQLNTQLQEQFGENFKELNSAVFKVVEWQQNYMETVDKTTGELQQLNAAFNAFTEKVVPKVESNIAAMTKNLKDFADTSQQNISVQKNLNESAAALNESVAQTQKIVASFESFSAEVLAQNNANLKEIQQLSKKLAAEINQFNDKIFDATTNASNYVKQFNDAAKDVTTKVRATLEQFDTDTKGALAQEMKTLASALAVTIKPLIGNYNALIQRIAELDKIINERGARK